MWNRNGLVYFASIAAILTVGAFVSPEKAVAANPERPYRGSCSTVVTPLTPPGVFPQELRIDYICQLAHLGRTTAVAMQVVTPIGPPVGGVVPALIENATIYTAASGDKLNVSFSGTAQINVVSGAVRFFGTEAFEGGTGRFVDAAGTADLEGTASIFTNLGFFTTDGRISY